VQEVEEVFFCVVVIISGSLWKERYSSSMRLSEYTYIAGIEELRVGIIVVKAS